MKKFILLGLFLFSIIPSMAASNGNMQSREYMCGDVINKINSFATPELAHKDFDAFVEFAAPFPDEAQMQYISTVKEMIDAWFQTKDTEFAQAALVICMEKMP